MQTFQHQIKKTEYSFEYPPFYMIIFYLAHKRYTASA